MKMRKKDLSSILLNGWIRVSTKENFKEFLKGIRIYLKVLIVEKLHIRNYLKLMIFMEKIVMYGNSLELKKKMVK